MSIVVAGIHTGIGKTVCSAIMVEALAYDYWKPVQAGDLQATDSHFIENHIGNTKTKIHAERYRLAVAASPHWAAEQEGVEIDLQTLKLPSSDNGMVIETAGGLLSPLNKRQTNLHLIKQLNLPVVLVCNDYLGSINHSLLTIAALRNHLVPVMGLVFCGREVPSTRSYIQNYSGLPVLFSIPHFDELDVGTVCRFAATLSSPLKLKINEFSTKR